MRKLKAIYQLFQTYRFLDAYCPNEAAQEKAKTPFKEVVRMAFESWYLDGEILLPQRYKLLLYKLQSEGVISLVELDTLLVKDIYIESTWINQPQIAPLWVRNKKIFAEASGTLKQRMREFEADVKKYRKNEDVALLSFCKVRCNAQYYT